MKDSDLNDQIPQRHHYYNSWKTSCQLQDKVALMLFITCSVKMSLVRFSSLSAPLMSPSGTIIRPSVTTSTHAPTSSITTW
eukprot:scaffold293817_cov83-Cyclotella_meneghiniana.AAC.1